MLILIFSLWHVLLLFDSISPVMDTASITSLTVVQFLLYTVCSKLCHCCDSNCIHKPLLSNRKLAMHSKYRPITEYAFRKNGGRSRGGGVTGQLELYITSLTRPYWGYWVNLPTSYIGHTEYPNLKHKKSYYVGKSAIFVHLNSSFLVVSCRSRSNSLKLKWNGTYNIIP